MAVFKDGSHLDSEWLSAYIALVGAYPGTLAAHFIDAVFAPAFRTNRTAVRPYFGLNKGVGGFFVMEVR
jgi:hypothetical protein